MNYAAPMAEHLTAADKRVIAWLEKFEEALAAGNVDAATALFADECYWRDLVSFTWNITTQEGKPAIADMLRATLAEVKPSDWRLAEPATETDGLAEAWISFETSVFRGKGLLRLKGDLCWTLLTTAEELKGHEEKRGFSRVKSVEHGVRPDRKSWLERKQAEEAELGITRMPYCVIVGGGQGGIGLGARLKRLGVPTIILDKHPRPGDHWRKRYKSLHQHDPVWYDHMPYLPFPDDWPVFAAKDKIGDWLESYTKVMELNYWVNSECTSAKFDEATKEWTIEVEREGHPLTLKAKQLVLATGLSAVPSMPSFEGMASFRGISHHSSRHPGGEAYRGMKAVVIGSNNSAHDICADFWEHGAEVTMVQRSSTHIATSEAITDIVLGGLYSEQAVQNGVTTNKADMTFASVPYRIMHTFHIPVYEEVKTRYADLYAQLEKAGFMLDFGDDESGLFMKYLRRGSGYYIDVGASELVADGKIKLKSGVEIERITQTGVRFVDGTELPADIIVYATGYSSMNGWAAKLISQEVADKVGKCWGLGSATRKDPGPWEGELRNMWKPTQQEALWFHGGNLHQSRHYSQFLSLQLKAREAGIETPVYGLPTPNHKS